MLGISIVTAAGPRIGLFTDGLWDSKTGAKYLFYWMVFVLEAVRSYLGYTGNLGEQVSPLLGFFLITIFVEYV
jgi:hypothetical protein